MTIARAGGFKMLRLDIRSMIEKDIARCEEAFANCNSSENLYLELRTRYTTLDKDFASDIEEINKPYLVGKTESDRRPELRQIKSKLEMYIQLDEIPIVYIENVASGVNVQINTKKFSNKGNIGAGNVQEKQKTINENGSKKTSWFKGWNWLGRKK